MRDFVVLSQIGLGKGSLGIVSVSGTQIECGEAAVKGKDIHTALIGELSNLIGGKTINRVGISSILEISVIWTSQPKCLEGFYLVSIGGHIKQKAYKGDLSVVLAFMATG